MLQPWRPNSFYDILQIDAISIEELDLLSVLVTTPASPKLTCAFQIQNPNVGSNIVT